MSEIKVPVFPESVADGTIVAWNFNEGDQVSRDAVLCEIETDKVVMEVVAQADGVLSKILKQVDDTLQEKKNAAVYKVAHVNDSCNLWQTVLETKRVEGSDVISTASCTSCEMQHAKS